MYFVEQFCSKVIFYLYPPSVCCLNILRLSVKQRKLVNTFGVCSAVLEYKVFSVCHNVEVEVVYLCF